MFVEPALNQVMTFPGPTFVHPDYGNALLIEHEDEHEHEKFAAIHLVIPRNP